MASEIIREILFLAIHYARTYYYIDGRMDRPDTIAAFHTCVCVFVYYTKPCDFSQDDDAEHILTLSQNTACTSGVRVVYEGAYIYMEKLHNFLSTKIR